MGILVPYFRTYPYGAQIHSSLRQRHEGKSLHHDLGSKPHQSVCGIFSLARLGFKGNQKRQSFWDTPRRKFYLGGVLAHHLLGDTCPAQPLLRFLEKYRSCVLACTSRTRSQSQTPTCGPKPSESPLKLEASKNWLVCICFRLQLTQRGRPTCTQLESLRNNMGASQNSGPLLRWF